MSAVASCWVDLLTGLGDCEGVLGFASATAGVVGLTLVRGRTTWIWRWLFFAVVNNTFIFFWENKIGQLRRDFLFSAAAFVLFGLVRDAGWVEMESVRGVLTLLSLVYE